LNLIIPKAANKIVIFKLINAAGKTVFERSLLPDVIGFSICELPNLSAGFYTCSLQMDGEIINTKLIIRH
jgi:hypothetical protein